MPDAEGPGLTDPELIARAARGDRDAFGAIAARHQSSVFRLAVLLTRSREEAEDVLQQAFLSAWKHVAQFRGDASVRTWLLTIARNTALSRRAQLAREPVDRTPLDELGVRAGWGGPSPEQLAIASQRAEIIGAAWSRLPAEAREVITLRDLEGMSGEQVAGVLGISLAAMKSRLHRARLALAAEVREEVAHVAR